MRLIAYNTEARVVEARPEEESWLSDYLSFPDSGGRWTGRDRVPMYNLFTRSFAAGLLPLVRRAAMGQQVVLDVTDGRGSPPVIDRDGAALDWLSERRDARGRAYQREAVEAALTRERGIIQLPTAAGKTEVVVGLARAVAGRWLFVAHRTTLARQAADRWRLRAQQHGVDLGEPGIVAEGEWAEGERLTCASFATLKAALASSDPTRRARGERLLRGVVGLIVDEAHTLPADTHFRVAQSCDARYRIGLSATPLSRSDRRSVLTIASLGPVIYKVEPGDLIEAGLIARPRIRMIECMHGPRSSAYPTWQGVYGAAVVRNATRNALLVEMAKRAAKPALLFVREIAHGRALTNALINAGIPTEFVWGAQSATTQRSNAQRLVRGHFDVLVCSVVFQEGLDLPSLRAVINGSGQKSVIATLQKLGRGGRLDVDAQGRVREGGDEFELWDVLDRGNKWLEDHARKRRAAYLSQGYETVVEASL